MQLTDLKPGTAYAYLRNHTQRDDDIKATYAERVIFKETTEDGKARGVATSSEWSNAGVYGNYDPADLFMTWEELQALRDANMDRKAAEREEWRESVATSKDFADEVASELDSAGVSTAKPKAVGDGFVFELTALELHDLLRMVDY